MARGASRSLVGAVVATAVALPAFTAPAANAATANAKRAIVPAMAKRATAPAPVPAALQIHLVYGHKLA